MLSNIYTCQNEKVEEKNEEVGKTALLMRILEMHNPKNFGSDQGLVSGCAGCVGGHINIGSGCTLTSQAAAQESATRGISR